MADIRRQCGECTLCCKLLPVKELKKGANTKCKHQFSGGCRVYTSGEMPPSCRVWNCRWIVNELPRDIGRPDRTHYVVDVMPDFITCNEDDHLWNMQVVQIWVDPRYPDAHKDPALRAWLNELGEQNILALIRYNERDGFTLIPPSRSAEGKWMEIYPLGMQVKTEKTHTLTEIIEALGGSVHIVLEDDDGTITDRKG